MNKPQSASASSVPPGLDPDRAERAARMLDRFAEMAMEQAEAMHQAALAAAKAGDPAAAKAFSAIFDDAGRSLRRSLALQVRLAREQQETTEKKAAAVRARSEEKAQRRRQVARAVNRSIDADDKIDAKKAERLSAELWERLIEDEDLDAELALLDHPLEEVVIHLCRDLGIRPDPAWLDPDHSGADGCAAKADDSGSSGWPEDGPDAGRYWRFTEPGWYDLETCKKLSRPPWELKPNSS
ncbi:hypothetical protein FFK22_021290 [Mycobacterium sp. KBS0706]|uniref:hypothetical protein n=1 Tax=Mycobacterium sp. KBS0706 TaxID=2578109 RepID=UPI00117C85BF|nr:hypothetical protein [Mycobacterium sp. KBS0706]TSD86714.1 hypothetical protein FFK22_021290 [Mycobacterium sp. KBS0706]